ncbi:hypothetical protein B0T10DRAFT_576901 [Thelonectria olida]|uniref:Uncharacterized protein n=1 Tax=Thelonectria olida TaxID=1576542 RepID=A0A9P8VZW6_9HYPO|nr:hypothetical protein B0T10DRAFT_576901 [Thelonectria olida]
MNSTAHPSPSATLEEEDGHHHGRLERAVEQLREHMGLSAKPGGPPPNQQPRTRAVFFIERAPNSMNRGARCKLPTCDEGRIRPGHYRIALVPSLDPGRGRGSADLYHISCFEEIADFSQLPFHQRVHPITRSTFSARGVKVTSILDGNYLVDGGAERLILQWIDERRQQIRERDGEVDNARPMAQNLVDLFNMAGTPGFRGEKPVRMGEFEYQNLLGPLAPNECDGLEDLEVWNLFDEYLSTRRPGSLENRHDLSEMLQKWSKDTFLANKKEDNLNDEERQETAKLGPKAIRALRRLSAIPMPNMQPALLL